MEDVEKYKELILPILERYLIKRAAIFGSFAKNTATRNSDVGLLIEPGLGFTLFKMLILEEEISNVVNRKVDLVEYSAIKASIKNDVLASAISIL
jgi:predicted nucleotidyltransferase